MTGSPTRLRRLRLHGFKTFARATEVHLDNGITAVVGPNGSGKSNLVDAIRWALGETSARELRGTRMDEVIHNGGLGRPAMGRAAVSLVLDNESGRLPVEDAEVEISRRVTRHGDSEYRLNGARLRLRDLDRLLGSTGLTQAGYAVVAQNDVEAIVDASPAQRRCLVEEAAGVRGLRAAREDSLARVGDTEGRLLRLGDLLADADCRIADLAVQAEAALEQRGLVARLAELRGSLAREAWRAARAQAKRARGRVAAAQARSEAAREAEAGFTARITAARAGLAAAIADRDRAARALEAARLQVERAGGDRRRFEDQAVAAGLQRSSARHEEAAAVAEAASAEVTVDRLTGDAERAGAVLDALSVRRGRLTADLARAATALRDAERAAETAAGDLTRARARHDEAVGRAREHEARAALLDENAAALAGSAAAAASRLGDLAATAASAAREAELAVAEAEEAACAAAAAADRAAACRANRLAAEAGHAAAAAALREAEARSATLHGQVAGVLGGGAVAAAVERGDLTATRLVECFRVLDPADRAAVESALEGHLGAWLVADVEATFADLRSGGVREEVVAAGLDAPELGDELGRGGEASREAARSIEPDPRAAGALARLLESTCLVPDLEAARAALGAGSRRAVLPDGTVVTTAGVRGGGRPGEALALAAAEQEAQERLAAARSELAAEAARLAGAEAAAREAGGEVDAAGARADAARADAAAARARAAGAVAARDAEEERGASLVAEQAARQVAATSAREAAAVAAAEADWAGTELVPLEERIAAATATVGARTADMAKAEEGLRGHELDVARAEPQAREVQRRIAAARQLAVQSVQRARVASVRLGVAEDAALVALCRAEAAGARTAAASRSAVRAEADADVAGRRVPGLDRLVQQLEAERSEVAVAAARSADELSAAGAESAAAEARVADLADAVRDEVADDGPEPDAAAAERVEREIVRLERRVGALGPVNALAPEQQVALVERTSSLRTDHDDLAGACGDLRAIADHVAAEIDGRFEAVFGAVGYHFQLVFSELFPGGRATLRLEAAAPPDDDGEGDALPAGRSVPRPPGVEILAQPPGKRLQSLSLLSGGERALTALAMILALQQVNPSPFYVFDEVDAPLDDANIGRFTRLLRRLAADQQFIVVTHNHATMAAADALYGVTMGTDGVSRIISVRLVAGEPVAVESGSGTAAG